jgi:hypothetical protein
MRYAALVVVCVLACGCGAITEGILGSIVGDFETVYDPPVTVFNPPAGAATASRLAFVAAGDGSVSCFILDGGSTDHVMAIAGANPNGIAVGTSGTIFVSTAEGVVSLDSSWSEAESRPVEVTTVDSIAVDAGNVVVAGRTDEGAVLLVYDEASGALVGQSAPVPGVTIRSVTVEGTTAFVIEAPTGDVVSYELETPVPVREPVVPAGTTSGEPIAIVVGDDGNLLIASSDGVVEEIDPATGDALEPLFTWDPSVPPVGLAFDEEREHVVLLTADDVVRVIDRDGEVVEARQSPLVVDGAAIALLAR